MTAFTGRCQSHTHSKKDQKKSEATNASENGSGGTFWTVPPQNDFVMEKK